MVTLRAEPHVNAMESLRRQGLQWWSSSTSYWGSACLNDKRGLNPSRFARFVVSHQNETKLNRLPYDSITTTLGRAKRILNRRLCYVVRGSTVL